jgi:hypothetical protein
MLYISHQCQRCHFLQFGQHFEILWKKVPYSLSLHSAKMDTVHIRIWQNYANPTEFGSESTTLVETTYLLLFPLAPDEDVYVVKNLNAYRRFEFALGWPEGESMGTQVGRISRSASSWRVETVISETCF